MAASTIVPRENRLAFAILTLVLALGIYSRAQYKFTDRPPDSFVYMGGSLELLEHHRYALRTHDRCRATEIHDPIATCRMPGYSAVLAAVRPTATRYEDFYLAAKLVNAFSDIVSMFAVILLAWPISRRAAVVAAAVVMLHPYPIFMAEAILTESLAMAMTTVMVLLLVRWGERPRAQLGAALLLAAGTFVRPDALVLLPLFGWVTWQMPTMRARIGTAARCFLPVMLALALWGTRNFVLAKQFLPLGRSACDLCGQALPAHGVSDWMRTWIRDEEDVPAMWALNNPDQPNAFAMIPARAFATPAEASAVKALFTPQRQPQPVIEAKLGELAHARPFWSKLVALTWLPVERSALLWWHRPTILTMPNWFRRDAPTLLRLVAERLDWASACLFLAFAIALLRVWRVRDRDVTLRRLVFFCGAAILLRTGALALLGAVEQRYVLETWPLFVVIAALAFRERTRLAT